jgi:hypothetical protein
MEKIINKSPDNREKSHFEASESGESGLKMGKMPPTFQLRASEPLIMDASETFPYSGTIQGAWNVALRSSTTIDANNPHKNTIADIPNGEKVKVIGRSGAWLMVEWKGKVGYVSQELVAKSTTTVTGTSPSLSVDRIDIVNSSAGAIKGFPAITSGDLNSPGEYNNASTSGVNNSHQIHFHLDHGDSANLKPTRELQRSAWIAGSEHKNPVDSGSKKGGFNGSAIGPDGPPAHEIQRPSKDKIVIADAPGIGALSATQFPFQYKSHFHLKVADTSGKDIALIKYDVKIHKKSAAEIPNTENTITAVEKKDLVRGKNL